MPTVKPIRLQLSRRRGFRLQIVSRAANGLEAVKVDRTTKWGNPYKVGEEGISNDAEAEREYKIWIRRTILGRQLAREARRELPGKNLACWCRGPYCHANVLLEEANRKESMS